MKGEIIRHIPDGPHTLTVEVVRDKRLRSSARFTLHQDIIQIRVPAHLAARELDKLVDQIVERVITQRTRARKQNDIDLEKRARDINQKYFDAELRWHTIRWVDNMERRLGSCTSGGTTDGDIRISERARSWPAYVVDYLLAHELAHRKYPNHSAEFWAYLERYPHTERARGFIEGIAYGQNENPDDLI